ncbi:hypothetical protein SteCoe_23150 [Stentor coeruleus]|uniref:Uncharacterized protein n=1 Tax=Stentor coeruleus TaxID=5963 RepID=A0A1R2BKJ0_9CILI|nr:hypothetical protein SteCoe_23150 [Stentor coeruleus]
MSNYSPPFVNTSKKSYFFVIPICVVTIYALCHYYSPSRPLIYQEVSVDHEEFNFFIQRYGKSYTDNNEYARRFMVFRDNLAYIRIWNSQNHSWTLGINQFADLTISEVRAQHLNLFSSSQNTYSNANNEALRGSKYNSDQIKAPSSVNWVSKGMVGPVINEGQMGSSTTIVAANNVASVWAINGHSYTELSYSELYDCVGNQASFGQYFDFIVKNGLTSAKNYASPLGTCNKAKVAQPVATISSYVNVTPNSVSALENALALGPVSVAIEADQPAFMYYQSGVINSNCGTNVDHTLLAVGYDTTASVPYYLAQNSWGSGWGMSGYVQIGIQSGPGVCGIQMYAVYPVV